MMITRCLETVFSHPAMDAVQIVAAEAWREAIGRELETFIFTQNASLRKKMLGFSEPGETRQYSILSGLRDIMRKASAEDVVMVHDAARPNLSPS